MTDISDRLAEALRPILRDIAAFPSHTMSSDACIADFAPDTTAAARALADYDASKLRQVPDPLTVAYVAIGAHAEWDDRDSSQLDYISDAIQYALALDRIADAFGPDQSAVFAYEIAEDFGRTFATAENPAPQAIAEMCFAAAGYTTPDGSTVAEFVAKHWRVG